MPTRREVKTERLYVKAPGTDQLRKTAAASLRHLLATGWHETGRKLRSDHVEVHLERTGPSPMQPAVRTRVEEPRRPQGPERTTGLKASEGPPLTLLVNSVSL
jgi:hypothetical protein